MHMNAENEAEAPNALCAMQLRTPDASFPVRADIFPDTVSVEEQDPFTLYCAHSLAGLLAARAEDWISAGESLAALRRLASGRENEDLSWGDAVPFLEAVPREAGDVYRSVIEFASRITPNIEDADFRRRANSVGKQP
jgi:hypothetical protein